MTHRVRHPFLQGHRRRTRQARPHAPPRSRSQPAPPGNRHSSPTVPHRSRRLASARLRALSRPPRRPLPGIRRPGTSAAGCHDDGSGPAHGATAVEHVSGSTLAHTDLHALNLLSNDGKVRIVDWAWSRNANPAVDPAFLITRLVEAGHDPAAAETWTDQVLFWQQTPAEPRRLSRSRSGASGNTSNATSH